MVTSLSEVLLNSKSKSLPIPFSISFPFENAEEPFCGFQKDSFMIGLLAIGIHFEFALQ